jgi:hypothetical protein
MSASGLSSPWHWALRALRMCVAIAGAWLLIVIGLSVAKYDIRRTQFESAGLAFGFFVLLFCVIYVGRRRPDGDDGLDPREQPPPDPPSHERERQHPRITAAFLTIPAIVAIVAIVPFVWAIGLGPLSDDFVLRSWARSGTLISQDWTYARPFPLLLWAIVLKVGAGWPVLHAFNMIFHAATAALLAVIGTYLLQSRTAGLMCGLACALFPANFETVAWTAGVFDAVATLSVVGAAALLLTADRFSWRTVSTIAALCVIAVLSKETGVMLPFLLACVLPFTRRNRGSDATNSVGSVQALLLSAAVVGVYVLIRATTVGTAITTLIPTSRWQVKNSLVRPYGGLAMPFHSDAPALLAPIAAAIVVIVILLPVLLGSPRQREDDRYRRALGVMLAGLVWVLLATVPLLNQFFIAADLQGSRYLYLPLAGFAIAMAGAVEASRLRWVSMGALAALGIVWMIAWPWHMRPWQEAAALRDAVLRNAEQFVNTNRCSSLHTRGEPDNVRGAYVLRTGATDAMQMLPYRVDGVPCAATWADGRWVSVK